MSRNNSDANNLKPVSPEILKSFDALIESVEKDVLQQCLSEDKPDHTMGPDAEVMIKSGLGFSSKFLRTIMMFGTEKLIEDQLAWTKTRLPVYGVSMKMILNNFERYDRALKNRLDPEVYAEISPFMINIIQRQNAIIKATNEFKP